MTYRTLTGLAAVMDMDEIEAMILISEEIDRGTVIEVNGRYRLSAITEARFGQALRDLGLVEEERAA
jgi:hypothetical protein